MSKTISLDDLKPVEGLAVVQLKQANGAVIRELSVSYTPLSWSEWDAVASEIVDPKEPPKTIKDSDGEYENPKHQVWIDTITHNWELRRAARLFAALEKSGSSFPGETVEEKWNAVKKQGDFAIITALINTVLGQGWSGQAQLEALAESFPPQPTGATGGDHQGTPGLVIERVGSPASG